jgi:hypothetical protein
MDASDRAEDFVPAGLAALGIEADEGELQVIGGVHQVFWPPIRELLDFETEGLQPEPRPDFSKAPQQ